MEKIKRWLQPTLYSDKDVPDVFKEPFILTGYRPWNKSWTYYLLSIVQVHNETANVWSHLLGVIYCLYRTYDIGTHVDYSGDHLSWAILAFSFGALGYTSLSAAAHLLHSKSPEAHYLCYQIDYIGICLNCQAVGICGYFFIGDDRFYQTYGWQFLLVNAMGGVAVCAGCSISKLYYQRKNCLVSKLWRLIPGSFAIVCGALPLFYLTFDWMIGKGGRGEGGGGGGGDLILLCYAALAWTLIGAIFFTSYIPERFAPGKFDFFGHSHFIFHVILVYITHLQYELSLIGYSRTTGQHRQAMATPTLGSTFGCQLLAVIGCLLVLYLTRRRREIRAKAPDARLVKNFRTEENANNICKLKEH